LNLNVYTGYCTEVRRLIQLATEQKIQKLNENKEQIDQINKSNEELIEIVDIYEKTCIEDFSIKANSIKQTFNELVKETYSFINEKQAYLDQDEIDDDQIKIYITESNDFKLKLNKELIKVKNVIFNNNKIEFIESSDDTVLGFIDKCFTVSSKFYVNFIIFLINIFLFRKF